MSRWQAAAAVALALTLLHVCTTFSRLHERQYSSFPADAPLALAPAPEASGTPPLPAPPLPRPPPAPPSFSSLTVTSVDDANNSRPTFTACRSSRLRSLLAAECRSDRTAADEADEEADVAELQAALRQLQHPANCSTFAGRQFVFKDWRNGLGAQLSSLVGAWSGVLARQASDRGSSRGGSHHFTRPIFGATSPLLTPLGGLRYANKALCPKRDLSCYFLPFSGCDPPAVGARNARAAKTPPELSAAISGDLGLRRTRDKAWLRRELTRYVFRPNEATRTMLERVRAEMGLMPPRHRRRPAPASAPASAAVSEGKVAGGGATRGEAAAGVRRVHIDELVAVHIRRGDKRDLGAKERGEPFSDAMYVRAAVAVADEVGARGFLLASSEPETLRRLPRLLAPRPSFVMPAAYFVPVPEGLTPHQVIERTKQETGGNDEGRSQLVQLMLLAESRAFVGTVTSNFGLLVTKLMSFRDLTPVALDLSCEGLSAMGAGGSGRTDDTAVWRLEWTDARDASRCRSFSRREKVPPRARASK